MNRRGGIVRRLVSPIVVGALFLVLSLGGLTFQVARAVSDDSGDAGAAHAYSGDRFYGDVRDALSGLFEPAKALTKLTTELSSGQEAAPSVADSARSWERDLATARDRVGRLSPPDQKGGTEAHAAYEMGAALFVESARQAARVVGTGGQDRQEAVKPLSRLQVLGDRVFDVGTRVLRNLGPAVRDGGAPVERIPTPEVPDFRRDHLEAGTESPGPWTPQPVGGQGRAVAPGAWATRNRSAIDDAVRTFHESGLWLEGRSAFDGTLTASAADRLEEAARAMEGEVPSTPAGREGAHALRLSLLVEAESLRALHSGTGVAAVDAGQSLRVIAERLWNVSARLLSDGGIKTAVLNGER